MLRDWKGDGVPRSAVAVLGGGEGGGGRGTGSELPVQQGRASRSWPGCPEGPTDPGQLRGNAAHPRESGGGRQHPQLALLPPHRLRHHPLCAARADEPRGQSGAHRSISLINPVLHSGAAST